MALTDSFGPTSGAGAESERLGGGPPQASDHLPAGSLAWVARTLRESAMPPDVICVVLAADDPEIVRRHVGLHREWLKERLDEQQCDLVRAERVLTEAISTSMVPAAARPAGCGGGTVGRRA